MLKMKSLCESLVFIFVAIDNDDKAKACLHGLENSYKHFKVSIKTQENIPNFQEIMSTLVMEEYRHINDGFIQSTIKNPFFE